VVRGHRRAPQLLTLANAIGMLVVLWALVAQDFWMLCCGLAVHMAGKNWFMDRMVWLYDDMTALGHALLAPADAGSPSSS
jgi:hypothetical protein